MKCMITTLEHDLNLHRGLSVYLFHTCVSLSATNQKKTKPTL